ncbi:MAG: hypothetical protein SYC29_15095 [Planctomycetota bacterium]|nr:hypothetical protein [Planctomycetota bacterium]
MRSDVFALIAAPAVLALALGGCAVERTVLEDSAVDVYPTYEAELDFWDELATRPVVTNSDALYGLLLLSGEASPPAEYEGRVAAARARGWMGGEDAPPMNASAEVGLIAVAVCDILDLEGGLTMRVFGPSGRYCTRELVYREYIPRRTQYQSLSGLEFIDLLSRVEEDTRPAPEEEAETGT